MRQEFGEHAHPLFDALRHHSAAAFPQSRSVAPPKNLDLLI
jgi:hypothetical protein